MPKKTVCQIVNSGNDYLVKVKCNQKKLFAEMDRIKHSKKCIDRITTSEINRGRKEKRTTVTYRVSDYIKSNWYGAKTIVYVKRERKTKKGKILSHSYYLSSLVANAKEFANGVRHHWGIENRLHYVKDVTLKEDESKIKNGNAPAILSSIRNLIINIAHINGEDRIKKFMRQCAGNVMLIMSLLE